MLVRFTLYVHREGVPADVWCVTWQVYRFSYCFSVVRWVFSSSMVGLLAVLFSPVFFVILGDARPLLLFPCNTQ